MLNLFTGHFLQKQEEFLSGHGTSNMEKAEIITLHYPKHRVLKCSLLWCSLLAIILDTENSTLHYACGLPWIFFHLVYSRCSKAFIHGYTQFEVRLTPVRL